MKNKRIFYSIICSTYDYQFKCYIRTSIIFSKKKMITSFFSFLREYYFILNCEIFFYTEKVCKRVLVIYHFSQDGTMLWFFYIFYKFSGNKFKKNAMSTVPVPTYTMNHNILFYNTCRTVPYFGVRNRLVPIQ